MRVEWSKRADYIHGRHGIYTMWAEEAVNDEHALWFVPDPASRSGYAVRIIGHSPGAGAVVTVILIDAAADKDEQPKGQWWGSNAWLANRRDQHRYGGRES